MNGKLFKFFVMSLVLAFLLPVSYGCTRVAETGRLQINFLSQGQETALGAQGWQQIKSQFRESDNLSAAELIKTVGMRIAGVSGQNYQWEFCLFDSDQVNAFCLPGGKVAVHEGILPVMENEAALAAVMGHEVAHATCRHGAERVSQRVAINVAGRIVSSAAGQYLPDFQGVINSSYNVGTTLGVALPFSRQHETEADLVGLKYMARAGYDPAEALSFWQRMAELKERNGQGNIPAFLSTHPSDDQRIAKLREMLPQALAIYESSQNKFGRGAQIPLSSVVIVKTN